MSTEGGRWSKKPKSCQRSLWTSPNDYNNDDSFGFSNERKCKYMHLVSSYIVQPWEKSFLGMSQFDGFFFSFFVFMHDRYSPSFIYSWCGELKVRNIWIFSPHVHSKREKSILVLLSLYIFWGKCVYLSIFEWW